MVVDRILERLDSLINMGEAVLATRHSPPSHVIAADRVDDSMFRQWRTSSLAFLNMLPSEFIYRSEFDGHCKYSAYEDAQEGVAILKATKEDIAGGHLQKVETIVSAEVFSDFLEMAEHLLANGYKDPSASLIGAVLEDGLRRICNNNGVNVGNREDISSLNQKLAAKGIYNPLQQKQIQVWNDIRNSADHGHFDQYDSSHVKDMLSGVMKFLTDYLTL